MKQIKCDPIVDEKVMHSVLGFFSMDYLSSPSIYIGDTIQFLLAQISRDKVKIDVIKPWITGQVIKLLGTEDDVLISYIFNILDDTTQVCA